MDYEEDSHCYIIRVVNQYRHELYRYCKMLTRSEWDAEDLVQETLMKLFASGRKTQIPLQKAYVFRTATNAWIDICRKRKIHIEELQDGDEPHILVSEPDSLELHDSLELLLRRLPVSQAVVLLLVDVFQFTPKETGDMLNSTEGAVKAMLHRARTRIRKPAQMPREQNASRTVPASGRRTVDLIEPPQQLISRFIEAFRRHDPSAISRAYMELQRGGIEVGQSRREEGYILSFRFRDPEGNWCIVESEKIG
jgi:RNA polymerase sigma-70 factor (ECF subfamily)